MYFKKIRQLILSERMKIIEFSPERKIAKLKINNTLDLWHLEKIVERGDLITAKTLRTIFIRREEEKIKTRKKLVTLTIRVEKIDFSKQKNKLRLKGKIVEAPEDVQRGSYHTIEIGLGDKLKIEKREWEKEHIKRLKKARFIVKIAEPKLIQEFFIHINKNDGLAVYGFDQVKIASQIGAVKFALIPEEKIREKPTEELIEEVEKKRGKIKLISKKQKEGGKFCKIYDIGAILRFPIS